MFLGDKLCLTHKITDRLGWLEANVFLAKPDWGSIFCYAQRLRCSECLFLDLVDLVMKRKPRDDISRLLAIVLS